MLTAEVQGTSLISKICCFYIMGSGIYLTKCEMIFLTTKPALDDSLRYRYLYCRCLNACEMISIMGALTLSCSQFLTFKVGFLSHIYPFLSLFLTPAGQLFSALSGCFSISEFHICLMTLIAHVKTFGYGCLFPICERDKKPYYLLHMLYQMPYCFVR